MYVPRPTTATGTATSRLSDVFRQAGKDIRRTGLKSRHEPVSPGHLCLSAPDVETTWSHQQDARFVQRGRYGAMTHTITNNFHTLREVRISLLDLVQFHPPSLLCCAGTVWVVLEHHSRDHSESQRGPFETGPSTWTAHSPALQLLGCTRPTNRARATVRCSLRKCSELMAQPP